MGFEYLTGLLLSLLLPLEYFHETIHELRDEVPIRCRKALVGCPDLVDVHCC